MDTASRKLRIIAGPNGSGKTTFARKIYPHLIEEGAFLNADIIAQKLSPDDVGRVALSAGKQFLGELDRRLLHDQSILLETTLSGKSLLSKIKEAQEREFNVTLIFLWISTPELCDFRVKGRVASGGHNVPFQDIRRRYDRGLHNLPQYLNEVDAFEIFQANQIPQLICHKNKKSSLEICNHHWFSKLNKCCSFDF